MRIRGQLVIAFLMCAIASLLAITLVNLWSLQTEFSSVREKSSTALVSEIHKSLVSARDDRKQSVDDYFISIRDQVISMSDDRMVISYMDELNGALNERINENNYTDERIAEMRRELASYYEITFGREYKKQNGGEFKFGDKVARISPEAVEAQYAYIVKNPNGLGQKQMLTSAGETRYDNLHEEVHPFFKEFIERFGYYDLFLIEPKNGEIVYSVLKELDYVTSLVNEHCRETNIAEVFQRACHLGNDEVTPVDFARY